MAQPRLDLTGAIFGKLRVLSYHDTTRNARWFCRCACGNTTIVASNALRGGRSRSCRSCLRKHGMHKSQEYGIWVNIIQRCTNHKCPNFKHYGGRGIRICERWREFTNFYADMGPRPNQHYEIERKDNNGNYEPGNCVWASRAEQTRNTRRNLLITFEGRTLCATEWARLRGLNPNTVNSRLRSGMPVYLALYQGSLRG